MKVKCLLFGHVKYDPKALEGNDLIRLDDVLGKKLISVNVCERCGAVYSDMPIN